MYFLHRVGHGSKDIKAESICIHSAEALTIQLSLCSRSHSYQFLTNGIQFTIQVVTRYYLLSL